MVIPNTKSEIAKEVFEYIHLDRHGHLWKLGIGFPNVEGIDPTHVSYVKNYVHRTEDSWWVDAQKVEHRRLIGFLYTDPSQEEIEDYVAKFMFNIQLVWLSVSQLTETLNKRFPLTQDKEEEAAIHLIT